MKEFIENYFSRLKATVDKVDISEIESFVKVLKEAKDTGKTVFVMGNGGSALTASHFLCDIAKGVSYEQEKKFKIICLNDNSAIMMAYANDVSYEDIFVEQLKNHFEKGDVVVGFSGSGNSKNILKAIEYANENGGVTVGLTGYSGGKLRQMAQHSINTNVDDMQLSEDVHLMVVHIAMQILEKE